MRVEFRQWQGLKKATDMLGCAVKSHFKPLENYTVQWGVIDGVPMGEELAGFPLLRGSRELLRQVLTGHARLGVDTMNTVIFFAPIYDMSQDRWFVKGEFLLRIYPGRDTFLEVNFQEGLSIHITS